MNLERAPGDRQAETGSVGVGFTGDTVEWREEVRDRVSRHSRAAVANPYHSARPAVVEPIIHRDFDSRVFRCVANSVPHNVLNGAPQHFARTFNGALTPLFELHPALAAACLVVRIRG